MSEIPQELLERLLDKDRRSVRLASPRALANVAMLIKEFVDGGSYQHEHQYCPHCGGVVRVRRRVNDETWDVICDYFRDWRANKVTWNGLSLDQFNELLPQIVTP